MSEPYALLNKVARESEHQRRCSLMRRIRLEVMRSQWHAVEARCLEVSRKRIKSGFVSGDLSSKMKTINSMPKGISKSVDDSSICEEDRVQREVAIALAKIAVTDRIISTDFNPVPSPVKVAILHTFMKQRKLAYTVLLMKYWKV